MKKLWKYLVFILGAVVADQVSKYLVVQHIAGKGDIPLLPGILSLTYAENTGAAWSMLEGQRWLFVVIFAALTVLLLLEFFKFRMPFTTLDRWLIAAIYAGGLGNMIDRVRLGYVVDMIQTDFMDFPIFNVADCFITCGCIALIVDLVFFNKQFWKDAKK